MAKMRVHDLAKEYGMQSKEMLEHLAEMKIPAKSPSSTLEDAYVAMARKKLKPILEARAAEIRKKQAEAKKREEEEKKRAAAEAEAERLAAEKRREVERAAEEKKRAAEEAARKKAEAQKAAQAEAERKAAEEAERKRVKDTAPKSTPSFNTLLDQIAQQEEVLKQQAAESAAQKKSEKSNRNHARAKAEESIGNERRNNRYANRKDLDAQEDRPSQGRRKKIAIAAWPVRQRHITAARFWMRPAVILKKRQESLRDVVKSVKSVVRSRLPRLQWSRGLKKRLQMTRISLSSIRSKFPRVQPSQSLQIFSAFLPTTLSSASFCLEAH